MEDIETIQKICISILNITNKYKKLEEENIKIKKSNKRLLDFKLNILSNEFYNTLNDEQKKFIREINTIKIYK